MRLSGHHLRGAFLYGIRLPCSHWLLTTTHDAGAMYCAPTL